MEKVRISEVRAHLKEYMDSVCENREPVVITRPSGEPVVLLSLADYESMKLKPSMRGLSASTKRVLESLGHDENGAEAKEDETDYLLSNPVNASRLLESVEQAKRGDAIVIEIPIVNSESAVAI
jgi:antitoxin YefM